jgi:hypothetical protein
VDDRVDRFYALLYASVDTIFPFKSAKLRRTYLRTSPHDDTTGKSWSALSYIGSSLGKRPLKKRILVLVLGVAVVVLWPFMGVGSLLNTPLSMFLGYPIVIWAGVFGASELAFLLSARFFAHGQSTHQVA